MSGPIIDYCQQNKDLSALYNLTDYYNFYQYMINYTGNIKYIIYFK